MTGAGSWLLSASGAGPGPAAGIAPFLRAVGRLHTAGTTATTAVTTVTTKAVQHGHKQGGAAVVVSVVGLAAIIVLIVLLGSLSARRRTRDAPPGQRLRGKGPRQGGRGRVG
jgi:hypothetical protein